MHSSTNHSGAKTPAKSNLDATWTATSVKKLEQSGMAQECATDKDNGPKNPLSELMDLSETSVQVDGLLLHLTLARTTDSTLIGVL